MRHLATLVTMLLIEKRPHSDSYARRIRIRPMNVAAEMQWNLMPPRAFTNTSVTVSAVVEPAYEVGGDDIAAGLAANLAGGGPKWCCCPRRACQWRRSPRKHRRVLRFDRPRRQGCS